MTSFETINNKALSPKERINQAMEMLNPPYKDEEQFYAAATYLSYRELFDELTPEQIKILNNSSFCSFQDIQTPGLRLRWQISILMVDIYIYVKKENLNIVKSKCSEIKRIFEKDGWHLWPATVCNYLRSQLILGQILSNQDYKNEAIYILKQTVEMWKKCVNNTNFFTFPYRFTEMREDIIELQAIIFLLRDLGEIEDKREFDWMTKQKIFKMWKKEMQDTMYKLNWK
jgi:hypothetical protein